MSQMYVWLLINYILYIYNCFGNMVTFKKKESKEQFRKFASTYGKVIYNC